MFGFSRKEEKEQLAIEKRRIAEEERKKRIFDAQVRTIGLDKDGIDQQLKEKREIDGAEKERDQFFDDQRMIHTKHGQFLERKKEAYRKQMAKETDQFRLNEQKREYTREFDLNDPDSLKKDLPARVDDDDPRLSVSGLQKFHGEDLTKQSRLMAQKDQMRSWIEQQIQEKTLRKDMDDAERLMYERRMEEMNFLAHELDKQRALLRAEKERATKEYNIEQGIAKREKALEDAEKEEMDKLEEIQNMLRSDVLNEHFDPTLHAFDPNRFRPDHFKSLRPDQYQEIMMTREAQLLEAQLKREQDKLDSEYWAAQDRMNNKTALKMEREKQRIRREMNMELASTHKQQAADNQVKSKNLDTVYAQDVTEDFFAQFNTTSR
jgi:hypothetical protein